MKSFAWKIVACVCAKHSLHCGGERGCGRPAVEWRCGGRARPFSEPPGRKGRRDAGRGDRRSGRRCGCRSRNAGRRTPASRCSFWRRRRISRDSTLPDEARAMLPCAPGQAGGVRRSHGGKSRGAWRCFCGRSRFPRHALWRRIPPAAIAAAAQRDRTGRPDRRGLGAAAALARPSTRLSPENQFLRWLGRFRLGAIHPRSRDFRGQCHRTGSTPDRRRRHQPAFSTAAAADDARDVADRRRLRDRVLDLVSGDRQRLHRRRDLDQGARRVGRGLSSAAADRRGLRAGGRSGQHAPRGPHGPPRGSARGPISGRRIRRRVCGSARRGSTAAWLREWIDIVAKKPAWLTGVAYGPWTRVSLPELRAQVPAEYPLCGSIPTSPTATFLSVSPCRIGIRRSQRLVAASRSRRARGRWRTFCGVKSPSQNGFISLLRRVQRRRQQGRLERPELEIPTPMLKRCCGNTRATICRPTWSTNLPEASSRWRTTGAARC